MFRDDPAYADKAARGLARSTTDITELLTRARPAAAGVSRPACASPTTSACSLQHGQRSRSEPKALLAAAGLRREGRARGPSLLRLGRHLQPAAAGDRRAAARPQGARTSRASRRQVIATGNIGCMTQIARGTRIPVVHTVELLDWATGGPKPAAITEVEQRLPAV